MLVKVHTHTHADTAGTCSCGYVTHVCTYVCTHMQPHQFGNNAVFIGVLLLTDSFLSSHPVFVFLVFQRMY